MKVKVAVIQDSPIFFDIEKTIDKIEGIVAENAANGCELILFPESFIPGYPRGFSFGAVIGSRSDQGRKLYTQYYKNSLAIESKEMQRLEEISKKHKVYLAVGATEKTNNTGSLFCSLFYISPSKGLLGVHRKIKPTGTERLIWAESDGKTLTTFDTKIGKLGGLICWENYMPFARMSMYQKGIDIYLAPTADARESWTATMRHIALEGRCFVLGCNQFFTKSMYPSEFQTSISEESEILCNGGSIIVSPFGEVLAGPLYGKAGILTATLDLDHVQNSKLDFDVVGHYSRNDIFSFQVNNQPDIEKE